MKTNQISTHALIALVGVFYFVTQLECGAAGAKPLSKLGIVFGPAQHKVPAGYVLDKGLKFDQRANGFAYGWTYDLDGFVQLRGESDPFLDKKALKDSRYAGTAYMDHPKMARSASWKITVPNGVYLVTVVA